VTGGAFVLWFDKDATVFGLDTAEQSAFQHWADTCGIDWTVAPRDQPLPLPPLPPPRPENLPGYTGHSSRAVDRNVPAAANAVLKTMKGVN
jgi:hypothetical protein